MKQMLFYPFLFYRLALFVWLFYAFAANALQTQVNEVTDLFDKHIEDKEALLQNMQRQNDNAIERIRSGAHHDAIEGIKDAEGKVGELNSIKESDLDMEGRRLRTSTEYQFYDENELEPDYTKPGNIMHKRDADDITSATGESLRRIGTDLTQKLKELGFNCKTVKGPTHKEPVYYIDIRREERTNTEYDQFFCEEPRRQYNCTNGLTVRCIEKNDHRRRYSKDFDGPSIVNNPGWLSHENACAGWISRPFYIHPGNEEGIRHAISVWTGLNPEYMRNLHVNPRGNERLVYLGFPTVVFHTYTVHFDYVDPGAATCDKWAEDWIERCVLR